ncbi:MAG: hypothetical protein ACE37F_05325 [Nannocystaceae bacterium]|nr:hypothetical protein [bacterium]
MTRAALTAVLTMTCLLGAACDAESEPTTDRDSARAGWLATGHALEEAGLEGVLSFDASVSEDGASAMATGTVDCPEGGTVSVEAAAEATQSDAAADLDIRFANCAADGVTIDGGLSFSAYASETVAEVSMSGDLEFSGAAEGECALDLSLRASANGESASGEISGSMCGWSWDELG